MPIIITSQSLLRRAAAAQVGAGISSVTGTIADGQTVTINGAGFGTMGGDVLFYAYGDEHSSGAIDGQSVTVGSCDTYVIGIGSDTTGQHLLYTTGRTRTGRSASMRRQRQADGTGTGRNGGFGPSNVHKSQLFLSFWRYADYPGTWTTSGTNLKTYYVFSNGNHPEAGGSEVPQPILHVPAGTNSWQMGANLSGSDPNIGNTQGWVETNTEETWQRWDSWIKMNSGEAVRDGEAIVWKDCVKGIEDLSFSWFGDRDDWITVPSHFEDVRIGYMDNGMTDMVIDYSDYYVADTPARVEIGDASTWGACSHREIQLARQADWSNTAIDVVLTLGSFASFSGTYLYIVGSDGEPINTDGFAVA